jgi:HK97 family phage prohead protease
MPAVKEAYEFKANTGQINIDEAQGIVECFVAAIGNKDSVGDIIVPGAFDASLKRRNPRVVWGHDWNSPIGKVLEIYEVRPGDSRLPGKMRQAGVGGLFARVQFNLKSERGRQAFTDIVFFGGDQEWSIGYKTLDSIYDSSKQANILREVELYEVSPVLHGANQLTATISIKADSAEDKVTSFGKSKWPMFDRNFAEMIRSDYPQIWKKGGNIKGNDQYEILTKIANGGGIAKTDDQIAALELREAWIARHEKDFLIAGVIAQIKWLAIGSRGEKHMKDVVREEIKKINDRKEKGLPYEDDDNGYGNARPDESKNPENVARALVEKFSGSVRIRVMDENIVIFDHISDNKEMNTFRVSYHYEDDIQKYMIGKPEKVEAQTIFTPTGGSVGQGFPNGSQKAPTPIDAIPQENITGDILRGRGPRRGNLERLLRYWRPIMKKPGGFRRCLVILADHPELYPLENICAWLHHETTGLWPNEGCHHPGMKNCKKKLKKGKRIVGGSIWSDSDFDDRLANLAKPEKSDSAMMGYEDEMDEMQDEITDTDVKFANIVLREFMDAEPEFMQFIGDNNNWVHSGDDDYGNEIEHEFMEGDVKPGGCGCGCGGKSDSLDDLFTKAGRVISNRNMTRLRQIADLLNQVIKEASKEENLAEKSGLIIEADTSDLFRLKSHLDPVLGYHKVECLATEKGLEINQQTLSVDAESAINNALKSFSAVYGNKTAKSKSYTITKKQ